MSVLAEFLTREADRLAAERPTREAELAEWQGAVTRLFDQLTGWIRTADTKGVLNVSTGQTTARERRLGVYTVPTLSVTLDGETVTFVPRGRSVVGGVVPDGEGYRTPGILDDRGELPFAGLVDVTAWGRTEESCYRVRVDGRDVWLVPHANPDETGRFRFVELTQPRFERLLVRELQ